MRNAVTMVVTIRNREASRIEEVVSSIRKHGADPTILIIDYGSTAAYSDQYQTVCSTNGLAYEKVHTEGWPWSRSHAINRGARIATTDFLATVDVDMVFTSNPIEYCLDRFMDKTMYHVDTYWLPRNGKISRASFAGHGNSGGYQFLRRSAFFDIGGYDEQIKFWGQEELDWAKRLYLAGYSQEWLPEPHRLYHRWHPAAEGGALRPYTASFITMARCASNFLKPKIDQDWGLGVSYEERPILEAMINEQPLGVRFNKGEIAKYDGLVKLCDTKNSSRLVKVEMGKRMAVSGTSIVRQSLAKVAKPVLALGGLYPEPKVNSNFDYLYSVLPALFVNGLKDYYIGDGLDHAYLLW